MPKTVQERARGIVSRYGPLIIARLRPASQGRLRTFCESIDRMDQEAELAIVQAIQSAIEEEREAAAGVAIRVEIMNTQKRPGMGQGREFSIVQAKIDTARDIAQAIRNRGET